MLLIGWRKYIFKLSHMTVITPFQRCVLKNIGMCAGTHFHSPNQQTQYTNTAWNICVKNIPTKEDIIEDNSIM